MSLPPPSRQGAQQSLRACDHRDPGNISLCYFTGNVYPDNIKVIYDGQVLFESGMVLTGENEVCQNIRYDYRPGKPTFITVTVDPSTSFETRWTYRLGCPQ